MTAWSTMALASASFETSAWTKRRLAAVGADELDGLLAGRLAVLGDDDPGALRGEHPGRDAAHPAARAGDDRDLVGESHRSAVPPRASAVIVPGRRHSRVPPACLPASGAWRPTPT